MKLCNIWLQSQGELVVNNGNIRLAVSNDFILYYKTFVDKTFRMFTHTPAHGAHITITNPNIHKNVDREYFKFLKNFYKNRSISFQYNPHIFVGGYTKNFLNFYMKVKSIELENICKRIKIDQGDNLHITISNTKNGVVPYVWY